MKNKNIPELLRHSSESGWHKQAAKRKEQAWQEYSSQIARRILASLDIQKMRQSELAVKLGISRQRVSTMVKGKENLTLETIYKLSEALSVELIQFPDYSYEAISQPNSKAPSAKQFTVISQKKKRKMPVSGRGTHSK